MTQDKRISPRMTYIVEVRYGEKDLIHRGRITDISETGLFIDTLSPWPKGSMIHFYFNLPAEDPGPGIDGEGEVVWLQQQVGMGIRFTRLSDEHYQRIRRFFFS